MSRLVFVASLIFASGCALDSGGESTDWTRGTLGQSGRTFWQRVQKEDGDASGWRAADIAIWSTEKGLPTLALVELKNGSSCDDFSYGRGSLESESSHLKLVSDHVERDIAFVEAPKLEDGLCPVFVCWPDGVTEKQYRSFRDVFTMHLACLGYEELFTLMDAKATLHLPPKDGD